ncbi:MAG TPA: tRNA (adenosine(37)-N6)-threonylcarbamoyltransferase complex dimerization subunit type 1 TsaB [Bacteroidia bacterium]|jgi:tRNA threonylcarbamoyladenosine biosynthesis protein TsaB
MALILNLETATTACSVSLGGDGKLLALKELDGEYTHAENLTLFIEDVLAQAGKHLSDLDAIAVSKGPGSYTGLRIGVSTAKGLCYSLDKPLIAVNTLEHLAFSVIGNAIVKVQEEDFLLCPMLDARRMEVYCAMFDTMGKTIRNTSAEIIDEHSFTDLLSQNKVCFFGDGSEKCKAVFAQNTNALFIDSITPSAKDMISFSENAFRKGQFEDLAYFEPFYLKDFVAGKKKGADL